MRFLTKANFYLTPSTMRGSMIGQVCGRCYEDVDELFEAHCTGWGADPVQLCGMPIGMYHCPDCGAMVLACVPHPELCKRCLDRTHPEYIIGRYDEIVLQGGDD